MMQAKYTNESHEQKAYWRAGEERRIDDGGRDSRRKPAVHSERLRWMWTRRICAWWFRLACKLQLETLGNSGGL
jgi:hypothetical protein